MPALSFDGLLVIALVAVAVPVLLALVPRLPVPGAVLEVVAGILVGPSVLGWCAAMIRYRCSRRRICGVQTGLGPSSMVSATLFGPSWM